ncbi:hypothetical protein BURKHO8Y_210644 [Burkholderia sp. 8Y]|nr:hypothetical protein BURKHO8Y_210644 [Burkholderia sp. 8Y]
MTAPRNIKPIQFTETPLHWLRTRKTARGAGRKRTSLGGRVGEGKRPETRHFMRITGFVSANMPKNETTREW